VVAAPRQNVWNVLQDPALLACTLPGCEALEPVGNDTYKGKVKIQVGPLQGVFEGTVILSEKSMPESYRMEFDGKGALGFVKGSGVVKLTEQGESTLIHYTGEANVGGRIASIGQRLMETSAKAIIKQTFQAMTPFAQSSATPPPVVETAPEQLSSPPTAGNVAETTPPIPGPLSSAAVSTAIPPAVKPPSQTEFALGVARHMFEDAVPEPYRVPVLIAASALCLLAFTWVLGLILKD
jgi:uncharacterized protein